MSEESGSVAAPEVAAPVAETPAAETPPTDAAPTVETPPPPEPPKTAEFQALARSKAKILKEQQASKALQSQLDARAAELEAKASKVTPLLQAMEKFEDDPEAFLAAFAQSKGVDTQHFFNTLVTKLAHKGEPPDPVSEVQKLREEMAAKEAAAKKEAEETQAKREAAAQAEGRKQIEAYLLADPDKYERVGERLATDEGKQEIHNHLMQMVSWYKQKGEDLTLDQAGQNLEAWYESQDRDRLVRLLGSKKLAPPEPKPTNDSATTTNPADAVPPAEQAATPPPQPPKSLPKTIPTGRATVPAAGRRTVQRPVSEESERKAEWARRLAEANKRKAG